MMAGFGSVFPVFYVQENPHVRNVEVYPGFAGFETMFETMFVIFVLEESALRYAAVRDMKCIVAMKLFHDDAAPLAA